MHPPGALKTSAKARKANKSGGCWAVEVNPGSNIYKYNREHLTPARWNLDGRRAPVGEEQDYLFENYWHARAYALKMGWKP